MKTAPLLSILCLSLCLLANAQPSLDTRGENWRHDNKWDVYSQLETDNQYLYLSMRVPEGDLQKQILITGWTVWIAPRGRKKVQKGLLFPAGMPTVQIPREPTAFAEMVGGLDPGLRKQLLGGTEMLLIGYYSGGEADVVRAPLENPSGFRLHCELDDAGALLYQARIPLAALEGSQKVRWGWETGGLGRPELRGEDAIGISGGSASNPQRYETRSERQYQRLLETYRFYASPSKWQSAKIKLAE